MATADNRPADRFPAPPVAILGIPLDNTTTAEAAATICGLVRARMPQQVVCVDTRFLIATRSDVELRRIVFDARLVLCTDRALLAASRWLGNALPERIAIRLLVERLFEAAAKRGYGVCLLGSESAAISSAVESIKRRHRGLDLTGVASGSSDLEPAAANPERRIRELKPDMLLVALGFPQGEKWLAANLRKLDVPVALGIGDALGSLNQKPSSPTLGESVRSLCLFLGALLPQLWRLRMRSRARGTRAVSAPVRSEVDWRWVKLPERLDLEAVNNDVLLLDQLLADGRHCLLEMSAVQFIDSTGIGHLVRLNKRIRATGRELVLLAPSEATLRTLKLVQLHNFFAVARDEATAHALIERRSRQPDAVVFPAATGGVGTLAWRGEITASNAVSVWESTAAHIRKVQADGGQLEVDLSQLRFIDSSGMDVMVRSRKLALERGLRLRFFSPQVPVRNRLRLAGLEAYLLGDGA